MDSLRLLYLFLWKDLDYLLIAFPVTYLIEKGFTRIVKKLQNIEATAIATEERGHSPFYRFTPPSFLNDQIHVNAGISLSFSAKSCLKIFPIIVILFKIFEAQ